MTPAQYLWADFLHSTHVATSSFSTSFEQMAQHTSGAGGLPFGVFFFGGMLFTHDQALSLAFLFFFNFDPSKSGGATALPAPMVVTPLNYKNITNQRLI